MSSSILASGLGGRKFKAVLDHGFKEAAPEALGVAVPYVSVAGFGYIQQLVVKHSVRNLRLVTDIGDGITHPTALAAALNRGWNVRVVDHLQGTFHP